MLLSLLLPLLLLSFAATANVEGVNNVLGKEGSSIFLPLRPAPNNDSAAENHGDEAMAAGESRRGFPVFLEDERGLDKALLDSREDVCSMSQE